VRANASDDHGEPCFGRAKRGALDVSCASIDRFHRPLPVRGAVYHWRPRSRNRRGPGACRYQYGLAANMPHTWSQILSPEAIIKPNSWVRSITLAVEIALMHSIIACSDNENPVTIVSET